MSLTHLLHRELTAAGAERGILFSRPQIHREEIVDAFWGSGGGSHVVHFSEEVKYLLNL